MEMADSLDPQGTFAGYTDERQPFGAYALVTAAFSVAFAAGLGIAHRRERLPERVDTKDIVLLGMATHKLARILTKDAVTSFVRAPFVHLEEKQGTNSLRETPRGSGMRHAVGELLSCPECTGQWVASSFVMGLLHAPRVTRLVASLYAALAIGDMLQLVYTGLKARA